MNITQVRFSYGRTVSDGKFGSERAKVSLTSSVAEGEDYREVVARLADQATGMAIAKLKESQSEAVLQAIETPEEREARWDRQRDEAKARAQVRGSREALKKPLVDELDGEGDDADAEPF